MPISARNAQARRGPDEPCWPAERLTDGGIDEREEQFMAHAEAEIILSHADHELVAALNNFRDPSQEWRRLFSELLGTFFLVLVPPVAA